MYMQKNIKEVKTTWPAGTRVRLNRMDDPQAPPIGTFGTVLFVDDIGQVHVDWDNGSSLALIPGVDNFERVG